MNNNPAESDCRVLDRDEKVCAETNGSNCDAFKGAEDDHTGCREKNSDNETGEITPHMERLLRLIREGSQNMVDIAVDELVYSCSSRSGIRQSNGKPRSLVSTKRVILQWRVIGRLQATLCCGQRSSWKARIQTAQALERIAQLVPRQDQDKFWQLQPTTPPTSNLVGEQNDKLKPRLKTETITTGNDSFNNTFLSLNQATSHNFWSDLLRQGCRLYARAASKFEEDQLAYEQEMLQIAIPQQTCSDGASSSTTTNNSIVQQRTTWQRQQLAKRLGLNALLIAQQDTNYLVDQDDHHRHRKKNKKTSDLPKEPPRKRQRRGTKKINTPDSNEDAEESRYNTGFQNLLVLEMQRSLDKSKMQQSFSSSTSSQLNPQQLLATELLYRMMDPSWQVRHGSLLGLLALVRAWQQSIQKCASNLVQLPPHLQSTALVQKPEQSTNKFLWPQDILVRCMAILVLDRFGDFSGSFAVGEDLDSDPGRRKNQKNKNVQEKQSQKSSSGHAVVGLESNYYYQGGVVAPIRETAGQLIALLYTLFPSPLQLCILNILQYTILETISQGTTAPECTTPEPDPKDNWEIRHGVLVAFKYIIGMVWRNLEREQVLFQHRRTILHQQHHNQSANNPICDAIRQPPSSQVVGLFVRLSDVAIKYLEDESDDVVSAAAQMLREIIQSKKVICIDDDSDKDKVDNKVLGVNSTFLNGAEILPQIFRVLQRVPPFSSCIPDVVGLLSELLESQTNQELGKTWSSGHCLNEIFWVLSHFLDSDDESVRVSALKSMASLSWVIETSSTYSGGSADCDPSTDWKGDLEKLVPICCDIIRRLFNSMLQLVVANTSSLHKSETQLQLERTWRQLCTVLTTRVFVHSLGSYLSLERELYISLLCKESVNSPTDYFAVLDSACEFLKYYSKAHEECFPSKALVFTLNMALQSPWISHREAACVLYRALAADGGSTQFASILPLLHAHLTEMPTCTSSITVTRSVPCSVENKKDSKIAKLCGEAIGRGVDIVSKGQDIVTAVESVRAVWNQAFELYTAHELETKRGEAVDVATMRLRASASAAYLVLSIPEKITPFVRALISSLKSETCELRLTNTVQAIVFFLGKIENSLPHALAYLKILNALCDTAIKESQGETQYTSCQPACEGLRVFAQQLPTRRLEDQSHPLWTLFSSINSRRSDERILSELHLIQVFCRDTSEAGSHISLLFAKKFVSDLTAVCLLHEVEAMRISATSAIRCMCLSKSIQTLQLVVGSLARQLEIDASEEHRRIRGCLLLRNIVDVSGPSFRPFVRSFLPVVMKLMQDHNVECSGAATSIFSSMVQLAPLVRLEESIPVHPVMEDTHTSAVIDHLILGKPIPPCLLPEDLSQTLHDAGVHLRDYQEEGISWLYFLQSVHLNGALCDSMGLGKTLQALVSISLSHRRKTGSERKISLIVCPSTLVGHWISEVERFFPGSSAFRPVALIGSALHRAQMLEFLPAECNLVVTSFSCLRSDVDKLEKINWIYCVLDEGHLLKNPKTATARAVRRIAANHKLILSGTMIQNRVEDLWAVFDFLMPNFLGTAGEFWKQYGGPITRSHSNGRTAQEINDGMEKLKSLHQKVLPFILRREKEQVLKELPPKNLITLRCRMSEAQTNIYRAFSASSEMKKSIHALQHATESQHDRGNDTSLGSEILRALFFLRLLCTHPYLVATKDKENVKSHVPNLQDSGKLLALLDLLRMTGIKEDVSFGADNDTSLLYCQEDEADDEPDAFTSIAGQNSFVPISDERHQDESECHTKCLIFAQFSQSLDVVEQTILNALMPSVSYLRLDGKVSSEQRVRIAEQFNSDKNIRILLLTTRVGSLGLNLTGADTVIFLEHDWNPFVDLQAMDRAHRIGQTKTVNVYRLVMQDTVEERIMDLQRKKTAMNEAVVNAENSSLYSLGTDRLLDIFTVDTGQNSKDTDESGAFDLDSLLERYREDYASSFSVSHFAQKSQLPKSSDGG